MDLLHIFQNLKAANLVERELFIDGFECVVKLPCTINKQGVLITHTLEDATFYYVITEQEFENFKKFRRFQFRMDLDNDLFKGIDFAKDDQYGYVTSCPSNLGTGMRASVHVKAPRSCRDCAEIVPRSRLCRG